MKKKPDYDLISPVGVTHVWFDTWHGVCRWQDSKGTYHVWHYVGDIEAVFSSKPDCPIEYGEGNFWEKEASSKPAVRTAAEVLDRLKLAIEEQGLIEVQNRGGKQ